MVYEQFNEQQETTNYNDNYAASCNYDSIASSSSFQMHQLDLGAASGLKRSSQGSIHVPAYERQPAFMRDRNEWSALVEATMPLKTSEYLKAANRREAAGSGGGGRGGAPNNRSPDNSHLFQESLECRSRDMSRKLVWVNLISLLLNLTLAMLAFYFSFVNNSSSASAFAADCVLDFISSAIVLWRYYGDLNSIYMHAREQIACIYLGALFEISALAIIIKASSDIASGSSFGAEEGTAGYDLVYLAAAATIACTALTVFKVSLYNTIRDKSILLDVINTVISTVFAMSIIMSQLLINVDASFWYMDPILSIVLALFMAAFGIKVISQNFAILRPGGGGGGTLAPWPLKKTLMTNANKLNDNNSAYSPLAFTSTPNSEMRNYGSNLQTSIEQARANNWQKSDYSSIAFV